MESSAVKFRPLNEADWPVVAAIFQQGIDTGNATFSERAPAMWEEWGHGRLMECRTAACQEGKLVGWATLSPVSSKYYYRGVAELSIYIDAAVRGQGVGSALMQEMIWLTEAQGFWTLEALVFPENTASMKLNARFGFKLLGVREKMGYMTYGPYAGRWRDVALLERRSKVAGTGAA